MGVSGEVTKSLCGQNDYKNENEKRDRPFKNEDLKVLREGVE